MRILSAAFIALLEFFDSSGGVNQSLLSREKRVRDVRDFDLDERIRFAVFPLDCFVRLDSRARQKGVTHRCVPKNDFAVFGVNSFFHNFGYFIILRFCSVISANFVLSAAPETRISPIRADFFCATSRRTRFQPILRNAESSG